MHPQYSVSLIHTPLYYRTSGNPFFERHRVEFDELLSKNSDTVNMIISLGQDSWLMMEARRNVWRLASDIDGAASRHDR